MLWELNITCLAELVWTTAEENWLQQCIERWEGRGCLWYPWRLEQQQGLYSVLVVTNLICRLHQGLIKGLTSMKYQRMVTSYLEYINEEICYSSGNIEFS